MENPQTRSGELEARDRGLRGVRRLTVWTAAAGAVLGVITTLPLAPGACPRFLMGSFHRSLALLAVAFLAVHVVPAVVDPFTNLGWMAALVPFSSWYRTFWLGLGAIAVELL